MKKIPLVFGLLLIFVVAIVTVELLTSSVYKEDVAPQVEEKKVEVKTPEEIKAEMISSYNFKETEQDGQKTSCLSVTKDNVRYCAITIYDTNKNKIKDIECIANAQTDTCEIDGKERTYDTRGNLIKERYCDKYNENNECAKWSGRGTDYKYDTNNNLIQERHCSWTDSKGNCMGKDEENNYYHIYSEGYDYVYNDKGQKIKQKKCARHYYADGACAEYEKVTEYKYNDKGLLNLVKSCYKNDFQYGKRLPAKEHGREYCEIAGGNGSCRGYIASKNADREITCSNFDPYKLMLEESYSYNKQGLLAEEKSYFTPGYVEYKRFLRDEKGRTIIEQVNQSAVRYEYNDKNQIISKKTCTASMEDLISSISDLEEDDFCRAFKNTTYYTYDDNGNLITEKYCDYGSCFGEDCMATEKEYCKKKGKEMNYSYNANNNLTRKVKIHGKDIDETFYYYDENNNMVRTRLFRNGKNHEGIRHRNDEEYLYTGSDFIYDKDKRIIQERDCMEAYHDGNGNCKEVGPGTDYIYDKEGNLFMKISVDSTGKTSIQNLYKNYYYLEEKQ